MYKVIGKYGVSEFETQAEVIENLESTAGILIDPPVSMADFWKVYKGNMTTWDFVSMENSFDDALKKANEIILQINS